MSFHPNQRFYDRIASSYDAISHSSERDATEKGLRQLSPAPGESVVEVGYGTGHALVALAESVGSDGNVSGLDVSEKMKEISADRVAKAGLDERVDLSVGAAPPLPFEDGIFDAAFYSFTLELFPPEEIGAVVKETWRILKPAGRCTVVAMAKPRSASEDTTLEEIYVWMHRHFPHVVDCHPIDVEETLRSAGFEIAATEHMDIWSLPVAIVTGRKP